MFCFKRHNHIGIAPSTRSDSDRFGVGHPSGSGVIMTAGRDSPRSKRKLAPPRININRMKTNRIFPGFEKSFVITPGDRNWIATLIQRQCPKKVAVIIRQPG
jgi:hypothetical protein